MLNTATLVRVVDGEIRKLPVIAGVKGEKGILLTRIFVVVLLSFYVRFR
jgi:hypothetical protein